MHVNSLTGFTAQELAANQPKTFLWEQGVAFTQTQNQVWFSKPVMEMNCPYLVCKKIFPSFSLVLRNVFVLNTPVQIVLPQLLLQYKADKETSQILCKQEAIPQISDILEERTE